MSDAEISTVMQPVKLEQSSNDTKVNPSFLGVFAADEMHLVNPKPNERSCWIMNTDVRGKPGEHWVAFYLDARPHGTHSVEYYDPLADPITNDWTVDLKRLLKTAYPYDRYLRYRYNEITDQSDTSSNCGEFCCKFLLDRLKGHSFAKASGMDSHGEAMIEKWKKTKNYGSRVRLAKVYETSMKRLEVALQK
jgi:hypothetical protein